MFATGNSYARPRGAKLHNRERVVDLLSPGQRCRYVFARLLIYLGGAYFFYI